MIPRSSRPDVTRTDALAVLEIERAFALSPEQIWELMWRPEIQPRWLGAAADIRLRRDHRFALSDAAGVWKRGRILGMAAGRTVQMTFDEDSVPTATTTMILTVVGSSTGGSLLKLCETGACDHSPSRRFWTQALNTLSRIVAEVVRRRDNPRQAVVIIHGIGEQEPGRTLTTFVNSGAVAGDAQERWVKPDRRSPLFELRRITVKATAGQTMPTTDVYEMYWAHVIRDTTIGQLFGWIGGLLLRPGPPRALLPIRWLVFALLATIAVLEVSGANRLIGSVVAALPIVAGIAWKFAGRSIALNYVGDAARYLSPKPANVAHRQTIREAGVDLLEDLHSSCDYDRIVVVGHSLGSVIAYDILTFAWIRMHDVHRCPRRPAFAPLRAVERTIVDGDLDGPAAQTEAWQQTRRNTQPWRVTDLVTMGSPLAHAETLMARTAEEFESLRANRVLPTCPPRTDHRGRCTFDVPYPNWSGGSARTFTVFDHGALFGTTRWTNLFFQTKLLGFGGDPVGGPVRPVFGNWVRDVSLKPPKGLFAHTRYWDPTARASTDPEDQSVLPAHLQELRRALGLSLGNELREVAQSMPAFTYVDPEHE